MAGGNRPIPSRLVTVENDEDLLGLRRTAAVVAEARDAMLAAVAPGITTAELDGIGGEVFRRHGARSAPRSTYGFPGATCISVNEEAAHGIPSVTRKLREGDLVNVDVSAELDGYWSDTGASAPVGAVSSDASHLLDVTKQAQREAMEAARAGGRMRDVGRAVERRARRSGLRVVKNLCGHGVGGALHEGPAVPSFDDGQRLVLWEGLVLAVEPFLSLGAEAVVEGSDGWTLRTSDGSLVAQFEHTMVVTEGKPMVLTA
jgi:methionyl aminopeptidase